MNSQSYLMSRRSDKRQSRRTVLKKLGAVAGVGAVTAAAGLTSMGSAFASYSPIKHILILVQENRSFDSYFGSYERAGRFGTPAGYSVPSGSLGGRVTPHHQTTSIERDTPHTWQSIHKEFDNGHMDGFFIVDGTNAMGFFVRSDLPYYYALADHFTLCGNYFCHLLGPSSPQRLALVSATSGGITQTINPIKPAYLLNWPTIADLLDQHGVSWKCYNLGVGTGTFEGFNGLFLFSKWRHDRRLFYRESDYFHDLANGTLPSVSFMISESLISEHPPFSVRTGEAAVSKVINALIASQFWTSSAFILSYDEGGGFFDHIAPPRIDAYGPGFRVPTLVISPWVKRGLVSSTFYEHSSILKFIEATFGLPTLASINHQFDQRTPDKNNDAANGATFGPPAPPRDGLAHLGNMYEIFDFSQNPHYYPALPQV